MPAAGDQDGRTFIVTGATGGIGMVTARELATRGATVFITARSAAKGRRALEQLTEASGSDRLHLLELELGDLGSVRACANAFAAQRRAAARPDQQRGPGRPARDHRQRFRAGVRDQSRRHVPADRAVDAAAAASRPRRGSSTSRPRATTRPRESTSTRSGARPRRGPRSPSTASRSSPTCCMPPSSAGAWRAPG